MSSPKLVIIGAHGMLGFMLRHILDSYHPTCLGHTDIDITSADHVQQVLAALQPDIVINAAAYTAVDDCETHQVEAFAVNAAGPAHLAMTCKQLGAWLIHYSTDYVFSGENANGYSEAVTELQPVNQYGASKSAGEQAIQDTFSQFYIIRTAWLYGPHGKNFVDTMLQLAQKRPQLTVVNDQIGCSTFTKDLAEQTKLLIEQHYPCGIYHVTNAGVCSWYEFACEIFRQAQLPVQVSPCTSAEFPRPAKRPAYSILLNTKLPPLRSWQQALADYLHHWQGQ